MASPLSRDRLKGAMGRARGHVGRQRRHPIESGIAAGDQLLSAASPPTGIFCFNDEMGIGVLHAARRCGLHVPSDLSVVSSTTSASRSTSIHR
jgi:DNA-binding LacI/PurR family transcriptional regulator